MSINDKNITAFLTPVGWQKNKNNEPVYQTAHISINRSSYGKPWQITRYSVETYTDNKKSLQELHNKYGDVPSHDFIKKY